MEQAAQLFLEGPLGSLLRERLRRDQWRLWTILNNEATLPKDNPFDRAGVASFDITTHSLSQFIEGFLRRSPGMLAIFENNPARKGDPFLDKCAARTVYAGDRVFHYARSGDSAAIVEEAIRAAHSLHLAGVLVESISIDMGQDLRDKDLRELVSKATALISAAFDGESYIVAELPDGDSIAPAI